MPFVFLEADREHYTKVEVNRIKAYVKKQVPSNYTIVLLPLGVKNATTGDDFIKDMEPGPSHGHVHAGIYPDTSYSNSAEAIH